MKITKTQIISCCITWQLCPRLEIRLSYVIQVVNDDGDTCILEETYTRSLRALHDWSNKSIGALHSKHDDFNSSHDFDITKLSTTIEFDVKLTSTHDHRLIVSHALLQRQLDLKWLTRWTDKSLLPSVPRITFRRPSSAWRKREIVLLLCHSLSYLFSDVLLIYDGRTPKREVLFAKLLFHDWSVIVTTTSHRSCSIHRAHDFQRYSFVLSNCQFYVIDVSSNLTSITATLVRQHFSFYLQYFGRDYWLSSDRFRFVQLRPKGLEHIQTASSRVSSYMLRTTGFVVPDIWK